MNRLLTIVDTKYQRLEYLESDGACYIDTNRVPNMTDIIEQKFKKLGTDKSTSSWYGSMPSSSVVQPRFGMGTYSQGLFLGANATVPFLDYIDTNIHVIRWQCTDLRRGYFVYTLDGVQNSKSATGSTSDPVELTSYLFARHGTDGVQTYDGEGTRIYYHKEYLANGTLVRNFVPVLRKSDNELGMLDLVEGKFYGNAGTGKFTANLDTMYAIIQGSPTVQDGRVSGFSSSNYLLLGANVPYSNNFEMLFKFTAGTIGTAQAIFDGTTSGNNGVTILISSNGKLFVSAGNGRWIVNTSGTTTLSTNTTYYVKFSYKNNVYKLELSTDNINWNTEISVESSSTIITTNNKSIGYSTRFSGRVFSGSIDLNRSYIKIDDTKYKLQAVATYGVEFDYATASGTRLFAAANLNFTPSTDVTKGTDDFKDTPCFESYNCLVRYDSTTQKAGVVAVEGSHDYKTYKNTTGYNVVRMFRKFYYNIESTASKLRVLISTIERPGWTISPMHYRNGKIYEWIGITVYPWGIDPNDSNVVASRSGLSPKTNIWENQCEVLARAAGMRMFGLKEVATLQILGLVKYANLNWQSFIGQGNTGGAKETKASVAQTDATSVIVANTNVPSNLSEVWAKCCVMINGTWYKILSVEAYDTNNTQINIDGTVTTTTNSNIFLGLFFSGATDAVKGDDGYDTGGGNITVTSRRAMKNLGLENLIGNQGERLGGGCSIVTVTDNVKKATVYMNPDPDGDYVFPNASNDKNWDNVTEALATASGDNKKFVLSTDLNIPILLPSNDSGNKTGDRTSATANEGVHSIFFGGRVNDGSSAGGFYSDWYYGIAEFWWNYGFRGVFVPL